ncbi:hypothetical protein H8E77_38860 [bacterium]|nr:hypothetical protein [bacterium]
MCSGDVAQVKHAAGWFKNSEQAEALSKAKGHSMFDRFGKDAEGNGLGLLSANIL